MAILYNLIFMLIALAHVPVYILKGKFHRGFIQRCGFLPRACYGLEGPVWIHAVSVGEAMAMRPLIDEIRKRFGRRRLIISTVTSTGNKVARQFASSGDSVVYLPWDLSWVVRGVIRRVKPSAFIIAETEIWPNLISEATRAGVPVIVVNGRISDSSFSGYRKIRFLLRPVVRKVSVWCMQTEADAQRILRLGAMPENVHITGNMKFDAFTRVSDGNYAHLRRRLDIADHERLFVAGSTHPGEERMLMKIYHELRAEACGIKMLIAPRHPERAKAIAALAVQYSFEGVLMSEIDVPVRSEFSRRSVFILDTIGELVSYYAVSDVVFVGGSLVRKGGHNILEPAAFGKPVFFGPFMHNFRDIAELFVSGGAGLVVRTPAELKKRVAQVLEGSTEVASLGLNAKKLIKQNCGATARTVDIIGKLLLVSQ
jgi:3-deoxy-D-manno-octulosonic-acid transferase